MRYTVNSRVVIASLALFVVSAIGLSLPVYAEHTTSGSSSRSGSGSTGANSTKPVESSSSSSSSSSGSSSGEAKTGGTNNTSKDEVKSLVDKFKSESTTKNQDELRSKESEQLKENRQKICENRKGTISSRISRTENFASSYKDKLDTVYTKIKAYHDSKNLSVANYDQLTAAVDAAQSDAATKLAALKALDTTVDCTQQNVADGLSAYRAALAATRDSLKTYRSALSDLIKAVHQAAEPSGATSTEGNN